MDSPLFRDVMVQGFNGKVGGLEEKLSAMESKKAELKSWSRQKNEENEILKTELEETKIQNGEL